MNCSKCNKKLTKAEAGIVLGKYVCHACLVDKFIMARNKNILYRRKSQSVNESELVKIGDTVESMRFAAEKTIDECSEVLARLNDLLAITDKTGVVNG